MNFTQKSLTNVRNNIGKYIIKTPVFRFDFIDNLLQKTGKIGEYDQKI